MDFSLGPDHEMIRKLVNEFAQKEVSPFIREWDRQQQMGPAVLDRMGELGILGICFPVSLGGQGMDFISLGLACEELEAVDSTLRVVMSVHVGLCGLSLLQWGTDEQQAEFLIPLARGERIGCGAFSEPGAGSDVANLQTTARSDGSDYVLNGEKMWISLASKADFALLTARTDPNPAKRSLGLSSFIVDLHGKGVTTGDLKGKLGVRAGSTGWISLQDVRVPRSARLGEEGEGFKITMAAFDGGRYTVAAGAAGLIRACLEASVAYAKGRKTFGEPIAEHQLVQAKLARMARDYEVARLLYLKVGWLKNMGQRNTLETSFAKQFATEAAFNAASEAIAVHGSYGYSDEFAVERYLRNARGAMIYEGTNEIHSLIQAGYALGDRTDKPLRREMPAYDPERWQAEAAPVREAS